MSWRARRVVATDYQALYQQKISPGEIASGGRRVKDLLTQYGTWIDKYRGGLPREWAGAIMRWESDGNFAAPGDPGLGEVGFYQVSGYVPGSFGMPAEVRLSPEGNVFAGLLEYQLDMAKWAVTFPDYVVLGTPDVAKLARLSFSVGWGGSTTLAKAAIAGGYAARGALYDGIVDYVNATGGMQLGSQSPSQVWFRVVSINPQWAVAEAASTLGLGVGSPTHVPSPPGYPAYTIPQPYALLFTTPTSPLLFAAAILGLVVLWRFYG
jgi:hypothetical protein